MTSRPRRANAGANMKKLMNQAEDEDEFYKDKYGGFMEVEDDSDFAQSEVSDDVVDSDFDLSENEPEEDDETNEREIRQEERALRRKVQTYKDPKVHKPPVRRKKMSDVNNLPKKPLATSSSGGLSKSSKFPSTKYSRTLRQSTHQMTFDRIERENRARRKKQRQKRHYRDSEATKMTQEELMEEAKITEVENTLWLEKFKNLEIEKTKKRPKRDFKESKDFTIQQFGYLEKSQDPETGEEKSIIRSVISFPSEESIERYFPKPETIPEMPDPKVCWVTGLPAKYKDPVTGLPFYNIQAFQVIRKLYYRYLEKSPQFRDNERVREYLNNVNESTEPLKMFSFGAELKPRFRYDTIQEFYDKPVQLNINPSRNRTINLGVNSSSVLSQHVQQNTSVLNQNQTVHQVQLNSSSGLSSLSSSTSSLPSTVQMNRSPFTVHQTTFSSPQKTQQNILQIQQQNSSTPSSQNNLQQHSQQANIFQQQNILQKPTEIAQQNILHSQQQQQQQQQQTQNILQAQTTQNIHQTNSKPQTIQIQSQIQQQQQQIQTVQIQGQSQIQTIQIPTQQTHIQLQQAQGQASHIQIKPQSQPNVQQQTQNQQQIQLQPQQQQQTQNQPMKMYITAVAANDNAYIIPRTPQDSSNSFVNINTMQNPPSQ